MNLQAVNMIYIDFTDLHSCIRVNVISSKALFCKQKTGYHHATKPANY